MAKPWIHAQSSAKRFGGKPDDYMSIHELLDSSKATIADNRHRALTHTSWFISSILPRIFGETATNSAGKTYSVRDVAEQHVLEDYGNQFIPTPQDFLQTMAYEDWMDNGRGVPPSNNMIRQRKVKKALGD